MYVPPETIRRLDEAIRLDFQSARDSAFWWLLVAAGVVAIGVILEGPEIVHESVRVVLRLFFAKQEENRPTASWIVIAGLLGWVLVVLGVAGEGVAEGLVSNADSRLESFNNSAFVAQQNEIARANAGAVSALLLAGDISDRADKLAALLKTEQDTTARFQKQASDSEARLEAATSALKDEQQKLALETRRREPRAKLIHDASISGDLRLRPFRGQKLLLVSCLAASVETYSEFDPRRDAATTSALTGLGGTPTERERADTLREIGYQLMQARWDPNIAALPCLGIGMRIELDQLADIRTQLAAQQLANVLHEALLLTGERDPMVTTLPLELPEYLHHDPRRSFVVLINDNPLQ